MQAGGRKTEDGGRKTEDGGRRTEDGGRRTEDVSTGGSDAVLTQEDPEVVHPIARRTGGDAVPPDLHA